jgi:hypothetical protein
MNMQTVNIPVAGTMIEAVRMLRSIHESDTMRQWRGIGGSDLRTWMLGSDLIIGCEDGPTSARAMLRGDLFGVWDVILQFDADAEGWFGASVVSAALRNHN